MSVTIKIGFSVYLDEITLKKNSINVKSTTATEHRQSMLTPLKGYTANTLLKNEQLVNKVKKRAENSMSFVWLMGFMVYPLVL